MRYNGRETNTLFHARQKKRNMERFKTLKHINERRERREQRHQQYRNEDNDTLDMDT